MQPPRRYPVPAEAPTSTTMPPAPLPRAMPLATIDHTVTSQDRTPMHATAGGISTAMPSQDAPVAATAVPLAMSPAVVGQPSPTAEDAAPATQTPAVSMAQPIAIPMGPVSSATASATALPQPAASVTAALGQYLQQ